MEYAGEVADVVLMNSCLGTDYVRRARELLERGARSAGRSVDEIEVAIGLATAVGDDSAAAKRIAARWIGLYTSLFPNIARATGVDPAVLAPIAQAFAEQGLEAAAERVDDDLVERLAVAGTPDECRARLDAYRAAGVDVPVVTPLEGTFDLAVETLA
jgi:5,10-methylenetetrahydromethanopterin reductase